MLRSKELGPTSADRTPDVQCRIRFPPGSPRTDFWVSAGRVIEPAVCAVPPYEEMMLHELKDLEAHLDQCSAAIWYDPSWVGTRGWRCCVELSS